MSVAAIRCSRSPTGQPFPERLTHHDARDAPKASHFSQTAPRTAFPAAVLSNPVSIPSALSLFQTSCSCSERLPHPECPAPIPSALSCCLPHAASPLSRTVHSGSSPHTPRSPLHPDIPRSPLHPDIPRSTFHPESPSHCMSGALVPPPVRNTLSRLIMFFITKEAKVDFTLPSTAECR